MPICYPDNTDWSCAFSAEELEDALADEGKAALISRSEALAWSTIARLTGYRLSLCPVTVRPCTARCAEGTWLVAPVSGFRIGGRGIFAPTLRDGVWSNGCGCATSDGCSCGPTRAQVELPLSGGGPFVVKIDGVELPAGAFRVENGRYLIRQDGEGWPVCQNMNAPLDAEGSFSVSYYPGVGPNDNLRYAAGLLANEFYKACSGGKCSLPKGVTRIVRQGISMELPAAAFEGGRTGLLAVDAVIAEINPNGLTMRPMISSPDVPSPRFQTWG